MKKSMSSEEKREATLAIEREVRQTLDSPGVKRELRAVLDGISSKLLELAYIDDEPFIERGGTPEMQYVMECFVASWYPSRIDSAIQNEPQTEGWYDTIHELLRIGYEKGYDNGVASHLRATTVRLHKDDVRVGLTDPVPSSVEE